MMLLKYKNPILVGVPKYTKNINEFDVTFELFTITVPLANVAVPANVVTILLQLTFELLIVHVPVLAPIDNVLDAPHIFAVVMLLLNTFTFVAESDDTVTVVVVDLNLGFP